jgi:inorganic pyrophosphatase
VPLPWLLDERGCTSCYTGRVSEFSLPPELPSEPEVLVESPRWSVVKRRADGSVDFIAPLPCPYNYGCIPGLGSGDGDPLDVVVLGPRLRRGERVRMPVVGVLAFLDAGSEDPKVICSTRPMRAVDRVGLETFFRVYALFKRVLHLLRGKRGGATRFVGWLPGFTRPPA